MKRLSSDHRKTPQNKEDKCPNFNELSKTSPLPPVHFVSRGKIKDREAKNGDEKKADDKADDNDEEKPGTPKKKSPSKDEGGSMKIVEGTFDEDGRPQTAEPSSSPSERRSSCSGSILGKRSARSMEEKTSDVSPERPSSQVSSGLHNMKSLIALQRDNDDLRRRIVAMEMNQGPMAGNHYRPRGPPSSMHPGLVGRPLGLPPAAMSGGMEQRLSEINRLEAELMMMRPGSARPSAGMGRQDMYAGPSVGEHRSPIDQQMMARAMQQGRMGGGMHRVPPPPPGSYYQGSSDDLNWNGRRSD